LNLIKTGINEFLWECLNTIQADTLFDDYYLVGGTALSLQIGHRISDDIDLFTNREIKRDSIFNFIKNNIRQDVKIINNEGSIFQLFIESEKLKLDFVQLPYKLLDPLIISDNIRMIDKNDLSAMKISAAGTRGYEAKDFVDIYYLLKYMTIDRMFENFKKKYETNDILHYVRSVIYFDDVKTESWKALKPIKEEINVNVIKNTLIQEVSNYERKILSSNSISL